MSLRIVSPQLTRLQNWRDVLEAHQDNMANPFLNVSDWADGVKAKYNALKTLVQQDPKRALDTQYDRQKVFIQVIDQWSDRLKRNFKYYYQGASRRSKLLSQDFNQLVLNARWRKK
jgi:hypothetical protein